MHIYSLIGVQDILDIYYEVGILDKLGLVWISLNTLDISN